MKYQELLENPEIVDSMFIERYVRNMHDGGYGFDDGDLAERIHKFDNYQLKTLELKNIRRQWATDPDTVDNYANRTTEFPLIVYDPIRKSIIDGSHRVEAAIAKGDKTIQAYVGIKPLKESNSNSIFKDTIGKIYKYLKQYPTYKTFEENYKTIKNHVGILLWQVGQTYLKSINEKEIEIKIVLDILGGNQLGTVGKATWINEHEIAVLVEMKRIILSMILDHEGNEQPNLYQPLKIAINLSKVFAHEMLHAQQMMKIGFKKDDTRTKYSKKVFQNPNKNDYNDKATEVEAYASDIIRHNLFIYSKNEILELMKTPEGMKKLLSGDDEKYINTVAYKELKKHMYKQLMKPDILSLKDIRDAIDTQPEPNKTNFSARHKSLVDAYSKIIKKFYPKKSK